MANGKFQISAAGGISASTGIADLVDVGINQSKTLLSQQRSCAQVDRKDCIRVTDLRTATTAMYGAGVAGLLEPVAELAVGYGMTDNLDVGGRVRGGMQRLDVNYQLMDGGPEHTGWTSLVSLSYSHQKGALPIPQLQSLLELLGMGDNTRHNFDLALAMGGRLGDYGWVTFGGRYLLGRYNLDLRPELPFPILDDAVGDVVVKALPRTDENGWSHQAGVFVNVLAGYKFIYVGAELSAARYTAHMMLLGNDEKVSGVAIQPSLIVLTRF